MLAFVYGTVLVFRNGDHNFLSVMRNRGWKYFILALVDVEVWLSPPLASFYLIIMQNFQANYIIVFAYQFTTLTSIQLWDCSTIPTVMILSVILLSFET